MVNVDASLRSRQRVERLDWLLEPAIFCSLKSSPVIAIRRSFKAVILSNSIQRIIMHRSLAPSSAVFQKKSAASQVGSRRRGHWSGQILSGRILLAVPSVLLGLMLSCGHAVAAQTPGLAIAQATPAVSPAPEELTRSLARFDQAASDRNLRAALRLFSRNFQHSDGLTYDTLRQVLTQFWQQYSTLSYRTALNSWSRDGEAIVAETTTTITGVQQLNGRSFSLNAIISSRQRYENNKIVSQEILSESSEVRSGEQPPTVQVTLPAQVTIGQAFDFDMIVQEPLGDRLLLGTAVEEPIQAANYLNTAPLNLELLTAGGLFKIGRAPALADDRWITGIIVREDGMIQLTRRLRVVSQ